MSLELRFWMQILGGVFYTLNKIFFSFKERSVGERARQWRIWAWVVYIIGLVPWLVILSHEQNWMVVFVEAGGVPAMFLGLTLALRREDENPSKRSRLFEKFFNQTAVTAAVLGIAYSLYDVGIMTSVSQWAELGVTIGFLVGTFRLAKDHLDGYLWFLLMNASAGLLMWLQGYDWLALQQAVSLAFVLDAYYFKRRGRAKIRLMR